MTITRKCKSMMALVLAFAMVISGLLIAKPAKADVNDPSVKVLGATIRLADGDNDGTQSMRIGIQIDNANKASACAIELTIGGKTYTVATKADKGDVVQDKLHSKDLDNNSVVYAVVLTKIPQSEFYSTIGIVGKAWNMSDVEFSSGMVEKNVAGVVATLNEVFPQLNITLVDGVLYKNDGDSVLTADDLNGYSDDPDPINTDNPVVTAAPTPTPGITDTQLDPDNMVTNGNFANGKTGWSQNGGSTSAAVVDYSNVLSVTGRWNSFSGPQTTITGSFNPGDVLTYQYKIKRSKTLDNYSRFFVIKFKESSSEHESRPSSSSDGPGNAVGDAEHWVTYYGSYTVQEKTDSITVIVMEDGYVAYSDSNPASDYNFYIDDVEVVRTFTATPAPVTPTPLPADPYVVDFSDLTWMTGGTVTRTTDANGKVVITKSGSDGEFGFSIPTSQYENLYDTCTIFYADGTMSGSIGVVEKYNTTNIGWQSGEKNSARISLNGEGAATISGTLGNGCLSAFRFFNVPQGSVTIMGIVFSCRDNPTPIPTPEPTPAPTATPEPTATPDGPVPTKAPYEVDLTDYSGENGGVSPTISDGVLTVSLSQYLGIKFNDVPNDADYKYVEIEYTLSGGNVNAYPNSADNSVVVENIAKASEFTKLVLPALSVASQGVKFFNFGGNATLAVKAITLYVADPSSSGEEPITEPTAEPEIPYTADLSQWSVEYGSPSVTIDGDGIAALTTGFGGVLFTDVPGDEYKYVVITYKKSGGDVNVYPDQDTEYKISDATDYTSVILSPQRTSGSQKVKVFNFSGTVTVYIKSIEFYKNEPSA